MIFLLKERNRYNVYSSVSATLTHTPADSKIHELSLLEKHLSKHLIYGHAPDKMVRPKVSSMFKLLSDERKKSMAFIMSILARLLMHVLV